MKPELAVLPLEVWADIFISQWNWISRQKLAQIANQIGDRKFTEKFQKLLHECGKQSLRYLDISSKQPDEPKLARQPKILKCRALLAVSPNSNDWRTYLFDGLPTYVECEFPEIEMPENIKTFKRLSIRHLDDKVFDFLYKIKPLFTNVFLVLHSRQSAPNDMRIALTHLLPMLVGIRGIYCTNECLELLEQHFRGTLAMTKELNLFQPKPASIPTCLTWLNAPRDFGVHGPRFLEAYANLKTILAIIDAVHKQFLIATTPSAFVIFLCRRERHLRADELTIQNATTKEELTVRNASSKDSGGDEYNYVEVLCHPIGADAIMREWIEMRADFEKKNNEDDNYYEANKEFLIHKPTIGRITNGIEEDVAGPSSTAAKKMKK